MELRQSSVEEVRLWQGKGTRWRRWPGGPRASIRFTGASWGGSCGRSRAAEYWTTPVFTRAGSAGTAQSGGTQERLADAGAVLVVDETGFLKKGHKSVGVQRQYSGTAGRIENCQIGVFLAYAGAQGRTLLDRELYLPQVWAEDWERRREAGVPQDVAFQTKHQLARGMLERALESGVPFGWVAGDLISGSDCNLRLWLEREGLPHVLAIKGSEKLWAWTKKGPRQVRADRLASQVDELDWNRCSSGDGAKGPRVYDWAKVEIRPLKEPGKGYWLLARRGLANPGELA